MKKLLKYLLLSIVALAFHMGAKADLFVHEDVQEYDYASAYTTSLNVSITSPKTDICIPRLTAVCAYHCHNSVWRFSA